MLFSNLLGGLWVDYVFDIFEKWGFYRLGYIVVVWEEEVEGKMCFGGVWGDLVDGVFFIFFVNFVDGMCFFVGFFFIYLIILLGKILKIILG